MVSPSIENMKILLDINSSDTSQDAALSLYLTRANNFVKDYCNVSELNSPLDEIAEDIAIYFYRNKGVENIQSEAKGSLSETYRDSLPSHYTKRLNNHRRMRFV